MNTEKKEFRQRLDFYWQSLSAYSVVLIVYVLLRSTIESGSVTFDYHDPLLWLLGLFILIALVGLSFSAFRRRAVIVEKDRIIFKNRFGSKEYTANDIVSISLGRDGMVQVKNLYPMIRIKLNSRKRMLRLRPTFFHNPEELIESVKDLKKDLKS
jgi:cytochrome c biogenesis factor